MKFLEQDLEDLIHESSQTQEGRKLLFDRGLGLNQPLKRQVKIGSYGVMDLFYIEYGPIYNSLNATIIELKKDTLKTADLKQLTRYMTGVRRFIIENRPFKYSRININGYLIGKDFSSKSDLCYLCNELPSNIEMLTYHFDIEDGLNFKRVNKMWKLVNEDFSDSLNHIFEGLQSEYDGEIAHIAKNNWEESKKFQRGWEDYVNE